MARYVVSVRFEVEGDYEDHASDRLAALLEAGMTVDEGSLIGWRVSDVWPAETEDEREARA